MNHYTLLLSERRVAVFNRNTKEDAIHFSRSSALERFIRKYYPETVPEGVSISVASKGEASHWRTMHSSAGKMGELPPDWNEHTYIRVVPLSNQARGCAASYVRKRCSRSTSV